MVLRANLLLIRVNPCHPWSIFPARQIHLADHAPVPTGSSHPLSPIKPAQAGNKSSALAEGARCDRHRFIDLPADDQAAPSTQGRSLVLTERSKPPMTGDCVVVGLVNVGLNGHSVG
jgi:hypothetical protein